MSEQANLTGSQAISGALAQSNPNPTSPDPSTSSPPTISAPSAPNPVSPTEGQQAPTAQTQAPAEPSVAPPAPSLPSASAPIPSSLPQYTPEQIQQFQDSLILEGVYRESIKAGAPAPIAQQAVQLAASKLQQDRERSMLENHPMVRQLAAEKAALPYAAYGVTAEDIKNAPSPEAMVFSAYTLAQKNFNANNTQKAANLQSRIKNGNDGFENSTNPGSGQPIDYKNTSGKDLIRNALRSRSG